MKKIILTALLLTSFGAFAQKTDSIKMAKKEMDKFLTVVTTDKNSVLEQRLKTVRTASRLPFSVLLYKPSYVLPVYNTFSPYQQIYRDNTPNRQTVMNMELKAQVSLLVPLIPEFSFDKNLSLNAAYTQLNYWQVFAASQYFRETNYEPELFFEDHFHKNWLARVGVDHQSNGRGGELERSWNRAKATLQFSGEHWLVGITAWSLIFKKESSDLHNPRIAHYLGHESLLIAYKRNSLISTIQLQNLKSGLRRGNIKATMSYPISGHLNLYAQYFAGFGQSLIEYDHRTQALGIGIAFNDWI